MKINNLCAKRHFEVPAEATTIGHKLALRGGYIHQTYQGIYTYSPIGWKLMQNISNIVRDEMNKLGSQEMFMPMVGPASLWKETDRYDSVDVLCKFTSRAGTDCVLNPTHEEIVTDFVRNQIESYKQLPFSIYQIQSKYRDELRARAGLIRTREFMMKDLYSFHTSWEDLEKFYDKCLTAYNNIYSRCGLENFVSIQSDTGDMGGKVAHEFMYVNEMGADTIYICNKCGYKANKEVFAELGEDEDPTQCPECKSKFGNEFNKTRGVEIGNIFQLGTKYTKDMNCSYLDENGKKAFPIMGCYGIGIGRTLACILEQNADEKSIAWPISIAPYKVHIVSIKPNNEEVEKLSNTLYENLQQAGIDTIIDDRKKEGPGAKFGDADLIGAPIRLIISPKNIENGSIEVKYMLKNEISDLPDTLPLDASIEDINKIISKIS